MEEPKRILIVDDERLNINVLADLLKPSYKISAAINGQQALKVARSDNPPDLTIELVRKLMDDVSYKRGAGKNIVTLTKRL